MNLFYRRDFLWHSWMVHARLAELQAEASLDLRSFILDIKARNRCYSLYPRFMVRRGELIAYMRTPSAEAVGFAGWLPYENKRWPIGSGKFTFKEFCLRHGLATPGMWRSPHAGMRDFLVKHDLSSSADGMLGPFASYDAAAADQALPPGGYYEQFVRGDVVKAWFWENRLAAVDICPMPAVAGDGRRTMRQLILAAVRRGKISSWRTFETLARFQNTALDEAVPEGKTLLADYRYSSPLLQISLDTAPSLDRHRASPALASLEALAPVFWNGIPEDAKTAALYTVDGILDAEGKLWLLEMNCNPVVHPEVYPWMLESLFAGGVARGRVTEAARINDPAKPRLPSLAL